MFTHKFYHESDIPIHPLTCTCMYVHAFAGQLLICPLLSIHHYCMCICWPVIDPATARLFTMCRVTYSFSGPTIVYCKKRQVTEETARMLQSKLWPILSRVLCLWDRLHDKFVCKWEHCSYDQECFNFWKRSINHYPVGCLLMARMRPFLSMRSTNCSCHD